MSFRLFLYLFLMAGFVAAPLASLSARSGWRRVCGLVLLIATLSTVGCFAYALDRSGMPPYSWWYCGVASLVGIRICAWVFQRHKLGWALILGAVFAGAMAAFHFLATDFPITCQRAGRAVQKGMTFTEVQSVISRELAKFPDYRVVAVPDSLPDGDGMVVFGLQPGNSKLPYEMIVVDFMKGRAEQARASIGWFWFSWRDVIGSLALCVVCWWRLGRIVDGAEAVERRDFVVARRRIENLRAEHYAWPHDEAGVLIKRALMQGAGRRIRELAYFRDSGAGAEMEQEREQESRG